MSSDRFLDGWQSSFKPMMDLVEINRKAYERIAQLQTQCITDCFNANLQQLRAFGETKDPKDAVEQQLTFFRTVESTLAETVENEVKAATEAREAISEIVESSYSHGLSFFKEFNQALNTDTGRH